MGNDKSNKLKEAIKDELKEKKDEYILKQVKFCRVLSEDIKEGNKVLLEATGFKELLNLTKEGIKNSVESALYENIKKRIKNSSFEFTGIIYKSSFRR
jgi:hypothetical protein